MMGSKKKRKSTGCGIKPRAKSLEEPAPSAILTAAESTKAATPLAAVTVMSSAELGAKTKAKASAAPASLASVTAVVYT